MKDAKFFLVVRFSVAPQAEAQVLGWLDGGHMAEVAGQPGFLWGKRIRLAPHEYSIIYGIESKRAFEAYENDKDLHARFIRQREPFIEHMKIERFAGEVVAHA